MVDQTPFARVEATTTTAASLLFKIPEHNNILLNGLGASGEGYDYSISTNSSHRP